ncbi:MAG: DUF4232 domain-containing protein [Mycobacteriales bacterium]
MVLGLRRRCDRGHHRPDDVAHLRGRGQLPGAARGQGPTSCTLVGYPGITLYDAAGAAMPFHYTHGHSQYVTWAPLMTVTLRPRTSAYLLVAKYRCDVGIVRDAATIRIALPTPHPVVCRGPVSTTGLGVSLSFCRGGTSDPGQTVAVSPIEPTLLATAVYDTAPSPGSDGRTIRVDRRAAGKRRRGVIIFA